MTLRHISEPVRYKAPDGTFEWGEAVAIDGGFVRVHFWGATRSCLVSMDRLDWADSSGIRRMTFAEALEAGAIR